MTFEEYAQENLVKHGFTDVDMTLVRMGWNAAKADGADISDGTTQAARAQKGGEAVGEIVSIDDSNFISMHDDTLNDLPIGTKLYTHPRASVLDSAERVLASLGHYQTESARCRARYKEVVTNTQGPKNPPVFCVLGSGHEGPHQGQHGANMRENLIEFGPAINVCVKCKVRWPCPDAEKVFKASATPQPADKACKWHSDDNGCWMSECGKEWYFEDGGPEDNGMNFCVKCGNRCIEIGDSEDGSESYDSAM